MGLDPRASSIRERADIEISPTEILLPAGTRRSQTRVARLQVTRYEVPEGVSSHGAFLIRLTMTATEPMGNWHVPGCVNPPRKGLYFRLVPKDW